MLTTWGPIPISLPHVVLFFICSLHDGKSDYIEFIFMVTLQVHCKPMEITLRKAISLKHILRLIHLFTCSRETMSPHLTYLMKMFPRKFFNKANYLSFN